MYIKMWEKGEWLIFLIFFVSQKPLEHSFISCLFSRMSPCGRNSLCKSDMRGIYPHPENNNQYVNCYGEKTYILSCGPGAVFDRLSKMCIRYVAAESKYY